MLWKDMEVTFEVKQEGKPYEKENFDTKWRITGHNWPKVKLLFYTSIKYAFQCFLVLEILIFL